MIYYTIPYQRIVSEQINEQINSKWLGNQEKKQCKKYLYSTLYPVLSRRFEQTQTGSFRTYNVRRCYFLSILTDIRTWTLRAGKSKHSVHVTVGTDIGSDKDNEWEHSKYKHTLATFCSSLRLKLIFLYPRLWCDLWPLALQWAGGPPSFFF